MTPSACDTCFDINLDIVWQTVKEELPALIIELEKVLSSRGTE